MKIVDFINKAEELIKEHGDHKLYFIDKSGTKRRVNKISFEYNQYSLYFDHLFPEFNTLQRIVDKFKNEADFNLDKVFIKGWNSVEFDLSFDGKVFIFSKKTDFNLDSDLGKYLTENAYESGLIFVDESGDEFYIDKVDLTMGGCLHNVVHLKKITEPKEKWFRSSDIMLEEMLDDLKIYKSDDFKKNFISGGGTEEQYQKFISEREHHYEYCKDYYAKKKEDGSRKD